MAIMNQFFDELKLEQHPDKTLIGRTQRGFDFLGYHFTPDMLSVAGKTIERFTERISRLYEQGADSLRIGQYVSRWIDWVEAGSGRIYKISEGIEPQNGSTLFFLIMMLNLKFLSADPYKT